MIFMILLLIGAAVASVAISYWNGEKDFLDAAIILAIGGTECVSGRFAGEQSGKGIGGIEGTFCAKGKRTAKRRGGRKFLRRR